MQKLKFIFIYYYPCHFLFYLKCIVVVKKNFLNIAKNWIFCYLILFPWIVGINEIHRYWKTPKDIEQIVEFRGKANCSSVYKQTQFNRKRKKLVQKIKN